MSTRDERLEALQEYDRLAREVDALYDLITEDRMLTTQEAKDLSALRVARDAARERWISMEYARE